MSFQEFCDGQGIGQIEREEFRAWLGERANERRTKLHWLGLFVQFSRLDKVLT